MYVMGGDDLTDSDTDILHELHKLDPATGEWKRCRDAPHGRVWHSGTVAGGSVTGDADILLVFGGETLKPGSETGRAPLNSMLSYDPEFEVWYEAVDRGHRPSARLGHTATLHTANGEGASQKLLVFGGWNGAKYSDPELRELHIGSDWSWKRVLSGGKPPFARAYHTATRLADDRVLVFGGNDGDKSFRRPHVLDLTSMAWSHPEEVRGEAPLARTGHAAVCLDGARVLLYGGWDYTADMSGFAMRDDLAVLDTETWTWSWPELGGARPRARVGHSLVSVGGSLVLFGGRADGDEALDDLYALRPVA